MSAVGYWYIATPYSKYAAGIEAAYDGARRVTARLMADRWPVYSPIVATHPLTPFIDHDPCDSAFWTAMVVAIQMSRRFVGVELKQSYYDQAVSNLRNAETQQGNLFGQMTGSL